ncbi:putative leucine aminopeptidase 2 [Paramyrothecium foliicola]|nr:putative leucine aminopeptidase 2 [Paramyrothecium foliicola]
MKAATASAAFLASLLPLAAAKDCKPPVDSEKLQELITEENLMGNLQKLNDIAYANGGNRAFGYPGYAASVDYIFGEVSKLKGIEVRKQDFPALFTNTTAARVSVGGESFRTVALTYTPSTPEEGITLPLVHAPEGAAACDAANYEGLGAEGNIVLVERGRCPDETTFAGKVRAAAAAGAVAVVLYNSDPARLTAGSLSNPSPDYVPAGLIDQEPGQALKARLAAGEEIEAFVQIVQLIEERITQNVIAETKGGDGSNLITVGAHLDSVVAGPGINDDGSGSSLILELAKGLSHFSTNLKVRFAWWGAEENGLWGSRFYVNNLTPAEVDDLLVYVNFDMVSRGFYGVFDGTGDRAAPGGPPGSEVVEELFVDYLTSKGLETVPVGLTGGTDYVPFLQVIKKPVGGLFTGTGAAQDACYHQACDNITNPNPEVITNNAKAAAHVISVLATDGVDLIPKTPANTTIAFTRHVRDAASLHVHDVTIGTGKVCDHDLI